LLKGGASSQVLEYESRFESLRGLFGRLLSDFMVMDFSFEKAFETAERFFGEGKVGFAGVDGTFYSERKGSKIHPLITESMSFFKEIVETKKTEIIFIHFNHSSRLLSGDKSIRNTIEAKGFYVADDGDELWL